MVNLRCWWAHGPRSDGSNGLRLALVLALVLTTGGCRTLPPFAGDPDEWPDGARWITLRTEWRDEASFTSLTEYVRGERRDPDPTIARTDPPRLEGTYWLFRVALPDPGAETIQAHLEWMDPDTGKQQTTTFAFPAEAFRPGRTRLLMIGLTGPREAASEKPPLAWRLRLLGDENETVASRQSFLWTESQ